MVNAPMETAVTSFSLKLWTAEIYNRINIRQWKKLPFYIGGQEESNVFLDIKGVICDKYQYLDGFSNVILNLACCQFGSAFTLQGVQNHHAFPTPKRFCRTHLFYQKVKKPCLGEFYFILLAYIHNYYTFGPFFSQLSPIPIPFFLGYLLCAPVPCFYIQANIVYSGLLKRENESFPLKTERYQATHSNDSELNNSVIFHQKWQMREAKEIFVKLVRPV